MSNGQSGVGTGGIGGGANWESGTSASGPKVRGGRRGRRVLLIAGGGVILLILLAIALAPTIGSSLAPGMIEGAVNAGIKGRVKVNKASIGWFSGLQSGPVEVYDPTGAKVASATVSAPVTLWKAVSGRYWSASRLDLGVIEVKGDADIKQYLDGTTNLDRSLAPKDVAASKPSESVGKPSGGSKPLPSINATLKVTELNVSVRNEKDDFKSEIGLKGFKGEAKVDADLSAPGGGAVKATANFDGRAISPGAAGGAGGAGDTMNLKLDADVKQTSAGKWTPDGIDHAKVKLNLTNAPLGVVDALASLGGAMVQGVGDKADVNVDVDGNFRAMSGQVQFVSAGLNADATLNIKDGVLTAAAQKPSTLNLKSTAFLENLPQSREGVKKASQQIKLTSAPSVQVTLERLSVPIPKDPASGVDVKTLDFRGAAVGLKVKVSEMSGQVLLPENAGNAAAAGTGAGTWKPFAVEPIELSINIEDLAKPITIATGTKATLDGQPAGDLSLSINAAGLLNKDGRLRAALGGNAGYADQADAAVRLGGMSTALLQPIVVSAMKDLPIDLRQDVGPTLDLSLIARADVGGVTNPGAVSGGLASLPPADIDAQVNSSNIKADIKARLEKGVLTGKGDGIKLTMESAAPLAQRIVAASREAQLKYPARDPKASPPPQITLTGAGKVELAVRDFELAIGDTDPAAILTKGRAAASLALSDLNAGVDMGGNKSPVRIDRQQVTMTLAPGSGPKVGIDGKLSHDNQPFTVTGEYTLYGLAKGMPQSKGPGLLAEVNPTGTLEIKNLPRSLLGIVPATAGYASSAAVAADSTEMTRAIANAVREAMGTSADVTLKLLPAAPDIGGGQLAEVTIATAAKGAGLNGWARLAEKEVELRLLNTFVQLTPANANPVLSAAMSPKPGETASPSGPPRLGGPVTVRVLVDKPVKIPMTVSSEGAATPDWARAGVLEAKIATDADVVVENIAIGGSADAPAKPTTLAVRGVQAELAAPLAGVPEAARKAQRANVKLAATALNRSSGDAQIAKLNADAVAMMDGSSPEATVKLAEINSAALEQLLGQKNMIVGAIGEQADATLVVKPGVKDATTVGEVISVVLEMVSPRITGAKLAFAKDDARLWLTQPSTLTWTPNSEFLNKFLSSSAEAAPAASVTIEQAQPITMNFQKLAVAMGAAAADAAGQPTSGPLKPGVFEVDVSVRAPSTSMSVPATQRGQPPTKVTIEGLNVSVSSPKSAAGAATSNPLVLDMNIDRVGGGGRAAAGRKNTAKVQVANLADGRGVVTSDKAVIDADVDIESFPTPIVDKLASQGGILTELLGPTVTLLAQARNVSKSAGAGAAVAGGNLSVQATSQRASAEIKGDVKNGRFVQSGAVKVTVREIRNELVKALAGSVPIIETLEKTPPDEPATIETTGLMVPLDNDLRKLNGRVAVDMGIARFTTNSLLGELIKGLGGRESGSLGKKVEPFVVNIKNGVATYDRFRLPVGEFFLETRGTVDLITRQIDVVTYAPIGALTDKAIGKLGSPLTGRLNEVLQVPFTTKGSMDNPQRLYPDVGLFLKEAGQNIIKDPGKIIGDVIGDVLKPKQPKK